MDTYPNVASIRNKKGQSALHVCLENSAIEAYQLLIQCRSPDLDVKEKDIFGNDPISKWKRIMEEKREKGVYFLAFSLSRLLRLPARGIQDPHPHPRSIRFASDLSQPAPTHRFLLLSSSRLVEVSASGAGAASQRPVVAAASRQPVGGAAAAACGDGEGERAAGVPAYPARARRQLREEAGARLRAGRGCGERC